MTAIKSAPRWAPHKLLVGTYQRLIEEEEDARDTILCLRFLRRVIPALLALPESAPSTLNLLVQDWMHCTSYAARDAVEAFVLRHWHVVPPAVQAELDRVPRQFS